MVVKREGGHRTVTSNNLWAMLSKDMGHGYEDGEYMRIVYAMYVTPRIFRISVLLENLNSFSFLLES
ncbi:putative transcription factor & chromatin remodeling ARID family [Helianthus anomalus]